MKSFRVTVLFIVFVLLAFSQIKSQSFFFSDSFLTEENLPSVEQNLMLACEEKDTDQNEDTDSEANDSESSDDDFTNHKHQNFVFTYDSLLISLEDRPLFSHTPSPQKRPPRFV